MKSMCNAYNKNNSNKLAKTRVQHVTVTTIK